PFPAQDSLEISWFKDGSELLDGGSIKIVKDLNHSRLQIKDCRQSDSGEIKIHLKNPFDKPGPPQGPIEVTDSSSSVIELKWKPPGDTGGSDVTNYLVKRQQVGQNMWKNVWNGSADRLSLRDRYVAHGKKYIYRSYSENPEGIMAGALTCSVVQGAISCHRVKFVFIVFPESRESPGYTQAHLPGSGVLDKLSGHVKPGHRLVYLPLREAIKSKTGEFRNTFNYTSGEGRVVYLLGEIRDLI
ncbi:Immunoglobulin-like and fibronectin type III domain-containing protein 1, partial [Triplophysa rosa]